MVEIGYALTSELRNAKEMLQHALQVEAAGFKFAMISDHFYPFLTAMAKVPSFGT